MADEPKPDPLHIPRRLLPNPGVRRARVCTECHQRRFLTPGEATWNCPTHGPRKTVWDPNHPYFGQDTTGPDWPNPPKPPEPPPDVAA